MSRPKIQARSRGGAATWSGATLSMTPVYVWRAPSSGFPGIGCRDRAWPDQALYRLLRHGKLFSADAQRSPVGSTTAEAPLQAVARVSRARRVQSRCEWQLSGFAERAADRLFMGRFETVTRNCSADPRPPDGSRKLRRNFAQDCANGGLPR